MTAARNRVLVVDDELGMRETLTEILEGAGYDVSTACNGEDLCPGCASGRSTWSSWTSGCRDGTASRSSGRSPGPPPSVVMMTAYAVEEQLRAAVDAQSFAVVHKPVPAPYLIDLVARAAAT